MTNQNNKSFILHKDSLSILEEMDDQQAGKFIKAIYQFQKTGELPELDFGLKMAINPFINQFKRDKEKYQSIVDRNKQNIAKRWNTKNTTGKSGIPDDTKNTYSDSKNKNDSDSKKDNNKKPKGFTPPTLEEIKSYCQERKSTVDANKFFDYYEAGKWKDAKNNSVKNWKQKLITWENKGNITTNNASNLNTNQFLVDSANKIGRGTLIHKISVSASNKAVLHFLSKNHYDQLINLDQDLRNKIKNLIETSLKTNGYEYKL